MVSICPGGNCTGIAIFFFDKVSHLKHPNDHACANCCSWQFLAITWTWLFLTNCCSQPPFANATCCTWPFFFKIVLHHHFCASCCIWAFLWKFLPGHFLPNVLRDHFFVLANYCIENFEISSTISPFFKLYWSTFFGNGYTRSLFCKLMFRTTFCQVVLLN